MPGVVNFRPHEFIRTDKGLDNFPDMFELWDNICSTAGKVQRIRDKYNAPVTVDCGYRSPAVNKSVGGVPTSAHLAGLAADIRAADGTEDSNRRLYAVVKDLMQELGVDQLIMYNVRPGDTKSAVRFMHVGFRAPGVQPRAQLLFK
jgi:zinc D-Ala-D-Ala carboxypeptidase